MWAKEKPKDPEPVRGEDVRAVAFEKGEICAWTSKGKRYVSTVAYNLTASAPYILYRQEYKEQHNLFDSGWYWFSFGLLFWVPFLYKFITKKTPYSLSAWDELVVRDPDQLREYSLVGIRQNIPAPIAVGL